MKLVRDDQNTDRTFGAFFADDGTKLCDTLELPWRNNQNGVSCFPPGDYQVEWQFSPKHGRELYHVLNVSGRDSIEIHIGNTVLDTEGCVLVGTGRGRLLCKDNLTRDAVLASHGAFDKFNVAVAAPKSFQLTVTNPKPKLGIVA